VCLYWPAYAMEPYTQALLLKKQVLDKRMEHLDSGIRRNDEIRDFYPQIFLKSQKIVLRASWNPFLAPLRLCESLSLWLEAGHGNRALSFNRQESGMKAAFIKNRLLPLVAVLALVAYQYLAPQDGALTGPAATQAGVVETAYAERRSGVWVEVQGHVARLLADDDEGSRHQRFIVELDSGHTVMVAHNIDLAQRVPLQKNANLRLYGRYEWNDRGGVIHWTHRDPENRRTGGWIEFNGTVYR